MIAHALQDQEVKLFSSTGWARSLLMGNIVGCDEYQLIHEPFNDEFVPLGCMPGSHKDALKCDRIDGNCNSRKVDLYNTIYHLFFHVAA